MIRKGSFFIGGLLSSNDKSMPFGITAILLLGIFGNSER